MLHLLLTWATLVVSGLQDSTEAGLACGNGLKIGEVSDTGAVLWTRLTTHAEALHRVREWSEDDPHWRMPGQPGEVRFLVRRATDGQEVASTAWSAVDASTDCCHQVAVNDLQPKTMYHIEAQGRLQGDGEPRVRCAGSFTTAPAPTEGEAIRWVVSTCQDFPRRDDPDRGHVIYRSMFALEPDFFIQTGDTLYYDKPEPFAKDLATARYKWNRMYALPNLRDFHARVPSYWMHDDHDVLKDDCWPGQTYGDLTWDQGLAVWREQIPQSPRPYRTFRWGRDLQVWLPEGREFRSPNRMPDGPEKSIFGDEQWRWLEESLGASDATWKAFVSATPVVGPDRPSKNDNHANEGFATEGARLRALLQATPGCFVINGDRHWQYHSVDPTTGLEEFGCGASSDRHAGGFSRDRQEPWQPFLRIAGGFVSVEIAGERATVRHHDVQGAVVHSVDVTRR